ncbi:unnamed protein product [Mytilus coruscus]|uniref:Uncharacterized protein n=1 Tax=Mytilus coruscus TaxID=42192 RepID=A0A6J8A962_MYTCO|nr:unnamed protein product [Mytilus coruscus]
MDYAGAIPRRRLVPDMDEHKRVTFSPKPDRVERYNSTPKRLQSPHSPIKKAPIPRYESIYLGDQYDIPEETRAWAAFMTVRDKNKGSSQTRLSSPPRPLPRSFKPADDKVTQSGKLPNKTLVKLVCKAYPSIDSDSKQKMSFQYFIDALSDSEIDRDILQAIPDDSLKDYIPLAGDRFVLREFCKKGAKTKKTTLIKKLRKRLNIQKVDSDSDDEPVKKSHLIGNSNAWKQTKKVSIGWLNYDVSASQFRQVKEKHGGSTRKFDFHKDEGKDEVLVKGKAVFFPGGVSKIGNMNEFELELRDFSHQLIKSNDTIEELYDKTGVSMLRFYLSTTPKNKEATTKPSGLDTSDQSDNSLPDPKLSHDFSFASIDNIPPLPPIEIFESDHERSDPEIAFRTDNVPRENNNDVTLRYVPNTNPGNDNIPTTSATLKIHRGTLSMMEMICYFKDPTLMNSPVSIIRVLPNGEQENAEDTGGKTFKIPSLRHDFGYMEWKSVARIMMYGYKFSGYWPIQLAKTFMEQCIAPGDEIETKELMSDFYHFVSVPDREVFKKAVDDFSSVDIDELLDALETHECKARPTDINIKLILKEIAHKEIIQAPKYIIDCLKIAFEETTQNL